MTREDIIRLYEKANGWSPAAYANTVEELERFAALVAASEREKVAAWMIERSYATGHGDTVEDLLKELEWQARGSEREACARVCDTWPLSAKNMLRMESWKGGKGNAVAGSIYECAAAIRARGQA